MCVYCFNPLWTFTSLWSRQNIFSLGVRVCSLSSCCQSRTVTLLWGHPALWICFPVIMLLAVRQIRHDSRQSEHTRTNSLSDNHGYPQTQPLKSGEQSGLLLGDPNPLCWDISRRTRETSPPDVRNKPKSETGLGRRKLKQFHGLWARVNLGQDGY